MFGHRDFSKARKRWDEFWSDENPRPLLSIVLPKGCKPCSPPEYLEAFNGDYQSVADKVARWYDTHIFLGDAIPFHYLEFGADHFASLLGVDLKLSEAGDTSWPTHTLHDLTNADIHFDPKGKWWQKTVEYYQTLKKTLGEDVMIAAPTLSSGLDALVALRGANNVLYDLVDNPDDVHNVLQQIHNCYEEVLNACAKLFEYDKYGSINRHGMYSTGKIAIPQCDFSCMLSPDMFDEFVLPYLEKEMALLDAVEYHLDGPGALHHLKKLSNIENLDIIQWVPGAGEAASMDWTDLYLDIISLKKGLIIGSNPDNLIDKCKLFDTKKLFIRINGVKTRTQAETLIEQVNRFYDLN